MPHSHYVSRREPPGLRDRFYFDPLATSVAATSLCMCMQLLMSIHPAIVGSRSLEGLHWSALVTIAAAMLVGGLRYLHGAMAPRKVWSKLDAMRVIRGGSTALAFGWGGYTLSILWSGNPAAVIVALVTGFVAIGYAGKARSLHLSERAARQQERADPANGG